MKKWYFPLIVCIICLTACDDTKKTIINLMSDESGGYTFFGGTEGDYANCIRQTADGGYILAGASWGAAIPSVQGKTPLNPFILNGTSGDMLVMKLDSYGVVDWYTYLGGSGDEIAKSIQQTADGGYIIAGYAGGDVPTLEGKSPLLGYSANNDFFLVKLDSSGAVDWYTFLGGSENDNGFSIQQTADNGYVLCGETSGDIPTLQGISPLNDYSAGFDMLVIKLDSSGNVAWYSFFGGANTDTAKSVQQTNDRGYVLCGWSGANMPTIQGVSPLNGYTSDGDIVVIKLDSSGNVVWYTFLGGAGGDQANSIKQTSDGGYVVTGNTTDDIATLQGKTPLLGRVGAASDWDIIVIKLASSGAVDWYTFLGGTAQDIAQSIDQTADGGYILCGNSCEDIDAIDGKAPILQHDSSNNPFVAKLDASGGIDWFSFYGGPGMGFTDSIEQTSDGGYILAGSSAVDIPSIQGALPLNPFNVDNVATRHDVLVIKLYSDGFVNHW